MDTPADVLQMPEVSQEILKYLDDIDTNNLEGNSQLQQVIQELRTTQIIGGVERWSCGRDPYPIMYIGRHSTSNSDMLVNDIE
jgi:hypothetical protein